MMPNRSNASRSNQLAEAQISTTEVASDHRRVAMPQLALVVDHRYIHVRGLTLFHQLQFFRDLIVRRLILFDREFEDFLRDRVAERRCLSLGYVGCRTASAVYLQRGENRVP